MVLNDDSNLVREEYRQCKELVKDTTMMEELLEQRKGNMSV